MKNIFFIAIVLVFFSCKKDPIEYTFEGTITSTVDGNPLSGATITISQKPFNNAVSSNAYELVGTTQTDAAGFYTMTFERTKVTEFKIEIDKEGYFDLDLIIGSGEVTSDETNVFDAQVDGMSWIQFDIQNVAPNDVNDQLTVIFYSYRTNCDGCIQTDYNYFDGIIDTTLTYTNTAGNYLKFSFNDGSTQTTDSLLMPLNDTISHSFTY